MYWLDINLILNVQLVKLNLQTDVKGPRVKVLKKYLNLGPIDDFYVVDLERQGQGQVVTCSGMYKNYSLHIVQIGTRINVQASVGLPGITGMWSIRSSTGDPFDNLLVVSFVSETRILAMTIDDKLEETEIEGFSSQEQTLFYHYAVYNQVVQVTSSFVRLVSSTSRELRDESDKYSINVATANESQVLLAAGEVHLVDLEIGDGKLTKVNCAQLEHAISCLDINPVGENPNYSKLAAVGMWTEISVGIFSMPDLTLKEKVHLEGGIVPCYVLCSFEWISYLLCALGDGHLLNFLLNLTNGELTDRKKGTSNAYLPSRAICCLKNQTSAEESNLHPVQLLDDQTFKFLSIYTLDTFERGCSILSCSFSDDTNVYYCVGTEYVLSLKKKPSKLLLIAEKETEGGVYSLNAFNGKLLAAVHQKIQLYKWMLRDDGSPELQFECEHRGRELAWRVQTRGDFIVVGDEKMSISLLIYKHEKGAIEEQARDYNANFMSAVEILDDDVYLGAEDNYNFRFRHGSLLMRLPDSDVGQIPTVIFGTKNGVIGVIASLPHEQFLFLEELRSNLRKVIKGVGGLSHKQWRLFNNKKRTADAKNFLDGDLIESFLDLSRSHKDEISRAMSVSVEELSKRVEELTRLH
ncbi:DNA damage-binding protein 1b-like [Tripterygium wilfordii]|uniref:DNA damage-binding protein 1b-like n=1 Tax=Tripterygium wilfordii TaxID=458696 RepID=A0A7J7D578_TRIWF|nr:DNA damage-binding protein 1b-like [Tripterygium wilfordii]